MLLQVCDHRVHDSVADCVQGLLGQLPHSSPQNLASSLALVTCKEPLRVSIAHNLRTMLSKASVDSQTAEKIIAQATNDNLELACKVTHTSTDTPPQTPPRSRSRLHVVCVPFLWILFFISRYQW